jgi:hypothetical protein
MELGTCCKIGADGRIRTSDPLLTRQPLFQLSYKGKILFYLVISLFEPQSRLALRLNLVRRLNDTKLPIL